MASEELKVLLTRNGVRADVSTWLAASPQDCCELKHFANLVDEMRQRELILLSSSAEAEKTMLGNWLA